jgi:hypothetical protein
MSILHLNQNEFNLQKKISTSKTSCRSLFAPLSSASTGQIPHPNALCQHSPSRLPLFKYGAFLGADSHYEDDELCLQCIQLDSDPLEN